MLKVKKTKNQMTYSDAAEMIRDDMRLHHDFLSGEYRKALNMAIEALKAQEWTPCSERLPEVIEKEFDTLLANGRKRVISFSDSVYVTLKLKKSGKYVVKEAILIDNEWIFHFSPDEDMNSLSYYGEVIAWKPLPEPYRSESVDKE